MKKITTLITLLVVSFGFAQPTTNATLPTRLQADVLSVYSDSYTPVGGVALTPYWDQPAGYVAPNISYNPTGATTNPNYVYHASTLTYQGIEFEDRNLTQAGMEKLHLDVYTTNCTSLDVYIIGRNAGERKVTVTPTLNGWNSFDIPLTDYSSQSLSLSAIFQFKFVSVTPANSNVFFDNIYFWKAPVAVGTPVYGAFSVPAKNTGDPAFAITAPTSTSPAPITYSSSNLSVATISGNIITIVGAGTSTITASQVAQGSYLAGSTNAQFVVTEVPSVAAPTPPARPVADVVSLFSNAYTNMAVTTWNQAPIWYAQTGKTVDDVIIAGNDTKKIDFNGDGFIGVVLAGYNNATTMTHFHMDYWLPSNTNLTGKVLNPKWSNHPNESGEVNSLLLTNLPTSSGSWASVDVLISTLTAGGPNPSLNREKIKEFTLTSNLGVVYVDNIYFHKNTTLSTQNFSALNIKMYPNPATNVLNIEARAAIQNVSIYNMLGQEVISQSTDNASVSIDVAGLQAGMYIIKTNIDGVTAASRFVKQ